MDKFFKYSFTTLGWMYIIFALVGKDFLDKPIEYNIFNAVMATFFLLVAERY